MESPHGISVYKMVIKYSQACYYGQFVNRQDKLDCVRPFKYFSQIRELSLDTFGLTYYDGQKGDLVPLPSEGSECPVILQSGPVENDSE